MAGSRMTTMMARPAAERWDETGDRTIDLPATATTNRALHEAVGHLYDELAIATECDGAAIPDEVFTTLETLYVAAAEDAVSNVTVTYELGD